MKNTITVVLLFVTEIYFSVALSISTEISVEDLTILYDYEGTDAEYGIHIESGMYGDASKFAYPGDHEVHLDGQKQTSTSKQFYGVPDTPPESDEGIEWLDPN